MTTKTYPRITERAIRRALDSLGKTSREIARTIKKRRIKATKRDSAKCAIAVFLRRVFGIGKGRNKCTSIAVSPDECVIYKRKSANDQRAPIICQATQAQMDFIKLFDQGKYPDIVK